jgi:hypothetical protein
LLSNICEDAQEQEEDYQAENIEVPTGTNQSLCNMPINNILAADDQIINIQVLKSQFAELNIEDKVSFARSGQDVIEKV